MLDGFGLQNQRLLFCTVDIEAMRNFLEMNLSGS